MIRKVLLLGDFSGVHKNLCEGLRNLGVEAIDASYGNAWRELGSTINFNRKIFGLPSRLSRNISPFLNYTKLINNDVVQFIHYTDNFNPRFGINLMLTKNIAEMNKKAFLISTGCDPHAWKYFTSGEYDFPQICRECLKQDQQTTDCVFALDSKKEELDNFIKMVKGVIPLIYEFAESHRRMGVSKLMKTIPIPLNTDKTKYSENIIRNKIVFFHGINRIGFKGTDLIKKALENVRGRYPNDIEVVIEGKMSLQDYLKLLARTNVVVDQIYALTYGMNALYGMALGKVVVGGGHPLGLAEYGLSDSPLIPVFPDIKSIEKGIERLIEFRKDIPAMGFDSRMYVEKVHHYELVAQKFLDAWESPGKLMADNIDKSSLRLNGLEHN